LRGYRGVVYGIQEKLFDTYLIDRLLVLIAEVF